MSSDTYSNDPAERAKQIQEDWDALAADLPGALGRLDMPYPETGTGKLNFVPEAASHPAHRIPYRGYWIQYDPPPIPTWQQHAWQWWHDEYDGAPDAHDMRHGSASSLEEAKREIDEQIAESEDVDAEPEIEPRYCYLCCITDEDDDAGLESAGFPDRYVLVCSYCKCSWQHQTDKREAWLAEESEV